MVRDSSDESSLTKAKVDKLDTLVGGQLDISGLDIAMDDRGDWRCR